MRRVAVLMENCLDGRDTLGVIASRVARIHVAIDAPEIAAGYVQPRVRSFRLEFAAVGRLAGVDSQRA